MRFRIAGAAGLLAMLVALSLAGCYVPDSDPPGIRLARVDPEEASERAIAGAALGAGLGTGLGATFSINPGIGSIVGAETGATLGGIAGIITSQPLPDYKPIPVPTAAVIPSFYDAWPPGWHPPSLLFQTPPPPPPPPG
jgi:hypothetical protein